jgi:hypothetical protein
MSKPLTKSEFAKFQELVGAELGDIGVSPSMDFLLDNADRLTDEIRAAIKNTDRQAGLIDAIKDFCDKFKARTKSLPKKKDRPERSVFTPKDAQAIAAKERVRERVAGIRASFFGSPDAPFALGTPGTERSALEAAWAWLEANNSNTGSPPLAFIAFDLRLIGVSPQVAWQKLLVSTAANKGKPAAQMLRELADALEGEQVTLSDPSSGPRRVSLGAEGAKDIRMRKTSGPPYLTTRGGAAFDLWEKAEGVAQDSGVWEPQQALEYILLDTEPRLGITVASKMIWGREDFGMPRSITITINAPTGPDELATHYSEYLKRSGLAVAKLSETQKRLLELKAITPGMSWRDRAATWASWCKSNPKLTVFQGLHVPRVVRQETEKAEARARWIQVPEIATTVPPLKPNRGKSKPVSP